MKIKLSDSRFDIIHILLLIFCLTSLFYLSYRFIVKPSEAKILTDTINKQKQSEAIANDKQLKNPGSLKLLFFGDLMLDRHVGERLKTRSLDYLFTDLFNSTTNIFAGYDLISANLEGAVTNNGAHYNPVQAYDFAFTPERINGLHKYGFNFFNIANNHISDQGVRGLSETRNNLDKIGFNFSGSTDAAINTSSLKIVNVNGQRIALVGLSMVYHDFNLPEADKLIRDIKNRADLIIVNIHWGSEYQHQFNKHQQLIGRSLVEAGADIVIGHHPHVVQGMEIYQGKPIFYSLGNFIFDQYFSVDTQQGLAIALNIDSNKVAISLFPLESKLSVPRLMSGEMRNIFLKKYVAWSSVDSSIKEAILKQRIEILQ